MKTHLMFGSLCVILVTDWRVILSIGPVPVSMEIMSIGFIVLRMFEAI